MLDKHSTLLFIIGVIMGLAIVFGYVSCQEKMSRAQRAKIEYRDTIMSDCLRFYITPNGKATPVQDERFKEYVKQWAERGIDPPTRLITKEEYEEVMRYVQDDIDYEESCLYGVDGDDDVD